MKALTSGRNYKILSKNSKVWLHELFPASVSRIDDGRNAKKSNSGTRAQVAEKRDEDTCVKSADSTVMRVTGAFGREAVVKQHNLSPRLSLASE